MAGSLDDGKYVTMSSLSIEASRATIQAQDVVATSLLSSAALQVTTLKAYSTASIDGATILGSTLRVGSTLSVVGVARLGSALSVTGAVIVDSYLSVVGQVSASQASITGTVTALALASTGTTTASTGVVGLRFVVASSGTTASSGATAKLGDGQLFFSVLSLTSNGGEFGFRSGNTVYRFSSDLVG